MCSPDGQGWLTSAVPGLAPWAHVGHHLLDSLIPRSQYTGPLEAWDSLFHSLGLSSLSGQEKVIFATNKSRLMRRSQRKPLIHCAVSGQPTRASGPWGRLCLASVTSRAGRQQQGLAVSCKPLIFPQLTIIRAALESKHSGRCRRRARGCCIAPRTPPSYCLACVRSFLWPVLCNKTWNCWHLGSEARRQGCLGSWPVRASHRLEDG